MHQAPIFRSLDVRLALSDVLRSTPTTPSVIHVSCWQWCGIFAMLLYYITFISVKSILAGATNILSRSFYVIDPK